MMYGVAIIGAGVIGGMVARELNVPHKNNGSLVVAFGKEQEPAIDALYERGIAIRHRRNAPIPQER